MHCLMNRSWAIWINLSRSSCRRLQGSSTISCDSAPASARLHSLVMTAMHLCTSHNLHVSSLEQESNVCSANNTITIITFRNGSIIHLQLEQTCENASDSFGPLRLIPIKSAPSPCVP